MAEPVISNPIVWEEFFYRYIKDDELYQLTMHYPEQKHLSIDVNQIELYNYELYEELCEMPKKVIEIADNVLNNYIENRIIDNFDNDCYIRLINISEHNKIYLKTIRQVHLNKLISLSGTVRRVGQLIIRFRTAAFECQRCGHITNVFQSGNKFIPALNCENDQCGRQGPFKLLIDESDVYDGQTIYVQEHTDSIEGGEQPRVIPIIIDSELVGQFQPGNKVNVVGIVMAEHNSTDKKKKNELEYYLLGHSITLDDEENDIIDISPGEREELELQSSDQNIIANLIDSFAPHIKELSAIKLALMVAIVSGPNITTISGKIERGYTHVLLCGDPATSKSQLSKYTCKLVPRSQYTTGEGSTTVGLTAAVVKDELIGGGWVVDAGALVLADKALCVIDEADALRDYEIKGLGTALSDSSVEIHKAGINTRLPCREPIVMALNPINGRFDQYEDIPAQINIKSDTLSRFDLIFTIFDIPNPEKDDNIANAILYEGEIDTVFDFIKLQKYLHIAKNIHDVELSDGALSEIKRTYLELRSTFNETKRIAITNRHLEGLKRITRSIAKLHLCNVATEEHANIAINLLTDSFINFNTDKSTGFIDSDLSEIGSSKSQRDRMKIMKNLINSIQNENNGLAPKGDIVLAALDKGLFEKDIENIFKQLMKEGKIFQPKDGMFKLT